MVTSACSDYFKYPFLLHNHLTCRSVLHADNVHTLLWLVHTFSIKGEYRGIVLSIAHYLVNARWIYFNDFLEFLPIVCSRIGTLASLRYIQNSILTVCEYIIINSNWSRI